jgi:hypothetical protein
MYKVHREVEQIRLEGGQSWQDVCMRLPIVKGSILRISITAKNFYLCIAGPNPTTFEITTTTPALW